jgi:uncharacterized protein
MQVRPWFSYVLPMGLFLGLTQLESQWPKTGGEVSPTLYFAAYTGKVLLVTVALVLGRGNWRDFRPVPGVAIVTLSVVLGLAIAAQWMILDGHYPALPLQGKRTGFDPQLLPGNARLAFLSIRFFGLVVMVPAMEELFWRSFLIRWLIHPDFRQVPLGRVTLLAGAITSILFALAHPEWLPALITGALWALLLWRTRSLTACLISHATANLALGIYVVSTGAWRFL